VEYHSPIAFLCLLHLRPDGTAAVNPAIVTYDLRQLGERYELVAIKAAGISLRKIMFPLAFFALLVSVGAYYYSNIVFPFANLKFRTILYDVRQKKMAFNIREGIWYSGLKVM
jgi:lipopolysaccharide export LptBFGC system permease protein LptF